MMIMLRFSKSLILTSCARSYSQQIPSHARVVIGGCGILSHLISNYLVQYGWNDIIVIDKGKISDEVTWRGSGIVSHLRSHSEHALVKHTTALFDKTQRSGQYLGWKRCGSLYLARTNDRLIYLKKLMASCLTSGIRCELVNPDKMKRLHGFINTDGIVGGVYLPDDGVVDAKLVNSVFAKIAKDKGVKYIEDCAIKLISCRDGKVEKIVTECGDISCDVFVNCLGMWAREIGLTSQPNVRIPVQPVDHSFFISTKIPNIPPDLPILRDDDGGIYAKQWHGSFFAGGMSPHSSVDSSTKFSPFLTELKKRIPCLSNASVEEIIKSTSDCTPDGKWIFGQAPGIENYYVAVGMNGNSVVAAGGIAMAVAQLIAEGKTTFEILPFDAFRFSKTHNNIKYLEERSTEIVGRYYAVEYPLQNEFKTARKQRCSPLYTEHERAGAVFGERMGFERPLYYNTSSDSEISTEMPPGTFMSPEWVDFVRDEYFHCRESVSLIDMSSYAKYELKSAGLEVLDFLQDLCCNNVDVPVGTIVPTGMQNERGGYENDCIILRPAENRFFMVSPTSQENRILGWMESHAPLDGSVAITNVTSMYTVLNVVGPKSEQLMSEVTNCDMRLPAFQFVEVDIGYASELTVMRYTSTGEPGYSIYIPSEYALHIYQKLMQTGKDYGLRNAGYFTLRFLRIEKFIPFWGEELDSNTTPVEAGLMNTINFQKEHFIGKEALMRQCTEGVKKKLVLFTLDSHSSSTDIWPWGKEPIYRNGRPVGMATSSGYGFSIDRMICLGFVRNPNPVTGKLENVTNEYINDRQATYEIDIAGKRFTARPSLRAPQIPIVKMGGINSHYVPTVAMN